MDVSLNKNKKRKSLSKVGNTPAKISKIEESSPSKTPDKKASVASPKNGVENQLKFSKKKTPKKPINEGKNEAKSGKGSELKQLPFAGTNTLSASPTNGDKKNTKIMSKSQSLADQIQQRVEKEGKDEVLKSLNARINDITSRPEITKSGKMKIRRFKKMIKIVLGEDVSSGSNQNVQNTSKSKQKKEKVEQNKSTEKAKNQKSKPVVEQKKQKTENVEMKSNDAVNVQSKKDKKGGKNQTGKKIAVEKSTLEESDDEEEIDSEEELSEDEVNNDNEEEVDDDDDNEEESADDEESADEEESADDEEESADDEEESEGDEEESADDEDENMMKVDGAKNKKVEELKNKKVVDTNNKKNQMAKDDQVEQKKDNEKKSRYILFIGNLGYSTTKDEVIKHFEKAGKVVDVRIPTDKESNKPRGFAYVEFANEAGYQKALDLNGSQLSNRKIKVEYTQGGNKKSENQKKDMKSKNFKLHAMRKQGKFGGGNKGPFKGGFKGKGKK